MLGDLLYGNVGFTAALTSCGVFSPTDAAICSVTLMLV